MDSLTSKLVENIQRIRDRIDVAASRAGRHGSEVTFVAVTKYVSVDIARELVAAGCLDLGESRPQELWTKAAALNMPDIRWHLIGHLQRNKVRRTLPLTALIHSADSLRLLEEIAREAVTLCRPVPVLLEVNVSGDTTKHGFPPGEMVQVMAAAARLSGVPIRGLMAMASREGDLDTARRDFRRLRELRDELARGAADLTLPELSMGMSDDFEVAVEEGATLVRVGSALFTGIAT